MLSVAYLPQPQEEGPQEEGRYRRYAEVPGPSYAPTGRAPSLQPLGCAHCPLFRFNPCKGSYGFEAEHFGFCKELYSIRLHPFQGSYGFATRHADTVHPPATSLAPALSPVIVSSQL